MNHRHEIDRIEESWDQADPALFPAQSDVDALRELLDTLANFGDNDQRARYVLSSNWLRENGARLAAENAAMLAHVQRRLAR